MDNSLQDLFSTSTLFNTNFDTNSDYENLRIIFEDVLSTVSFIDVEENVFKDEIPRLKSYTFETVNKINETLQSKNRSEFILGEIKELLQMYINLLNLSNTALKYVSGRVEFVQIQSLPLAICEILLHTFKHCKESDTLYGDYFGSLTDILTLVFKKANEIQTSLIHLINNSIIFDLSEENQIILLVEILEMFSQIGETVAKLDIKSSAEIWKAYIVLSQTHNSDLKSRVNIENVLKYHCEEIGSSLGNIIKSTEMKFVEKSLKISSFNLKIIIKLCGFYKDNLGDPYKYLFDLLIILNRYSIPYLHLKKYGPKFIDLIQIYVAVGAEPLLGCLMDDRQFSQYYFQNIDKYLQSDDTRLGAILLSISILKKILNSDEEIKKLFISTNLSFNIVHIIFLSLDKLHLEFSYDLQITLPSLPGDITQKSSLYEYLLIHTAAIIIGFDQIHFKIIQKLLILNVLQCNIWKAIFTIDLWCILARYGTEEFCYDQLKFLISILLNLKNRNRPEFQFLTNLIHRLYKLLSPKYKLDFQKQYPVVNYVEIWICIGLEGENLNDIAGKKIDEFLQYKNITSFNSMITILELLSTCKGVENKLPGSLITKLWMLNFNGQISGNIWFLNFTRIRTNITCLVINKFNNDELLKILKTLINLNATSLTSKFSNIKILKSLAIKLFPPSSEQSRIFSTITQLFQLLLKDLNPLIHQLTLQTFTHFAYHTKHETILANVVDSDAKLQDEISNYLQKISSTSMHFEYVKAQSKVNYRHKCLEKPIEPVPKKIKVASDSNLTEIVQRLKFDCDTLIEYSKMDKISDDGKIELSIIVSKLQNILKI